ncbi:MAG: MFS transporter [Limnochordia bacterium]|jgi:MFS family permease
MAKHRDVILVLLITVLYHTMNQMFVPTFPIYIAERGGDEVLVGLLVGLIPLGSIVAKSFFGKMSTRRSNLLVLRLGLIVATLVILLYFPFWGFGFLALVRLLQSIGLAGYVTGSQGLMAEQTTPANRGFSLACMLP